MRNDLDIEEEKMRLEGENFQSLAITSEYIDNFDYDVEVISESLYQVDSAEAQALFQEKAKTMMMVFPEIYQSNKEVLFNDFTSAYGEDESKYNLTPAPAPMPMGAEGMEAGVGAGEGKPAEAGSLPPLPPQ